MDLKEKRILVVDDDDVMLKVWAEILRAMDFSGVIQIASNGKEALELALENMPDLLITDWQMPEMDGIELIEKIREKKNGDIAIILNSGANPPEEKIAELDVVFLPKASKHIFEVLGDVVRKVLTK